MKVKDNYIWQVLKYNWEFLRRNKDYNKDWKNYEDSPNEIRLSELLKKWGLFSYPVCFDFSKRYDEIPKKTEDGWAPTTWSEETEKKILKAIVKLFPYLIKNVAFEVFSHKIEIDRQNSEKKIVRIDDFDNHKTEDLPKSEESIPDELVITIRNFKFYTSESKNKKAETRKSIIASIKNQLIQWGEVANDLKIEDQNTRQQKDLYDEYLKVWDLAIEGKTDTQIADELWPDEYKSEKEKGEKNGYVNKELLEGVNEFFKHISNMEGGPSAKLKEYDLLELYRQFKTEGDIQIFDKKFLDAYWIAYIRYLIELKGFTDSDADDKAITLQKRIETEGPQSEHYNNIVEQAKRYRRTADEIVNNPFLYLKF